jgi:putative hydrolase of the HAD superfamily
MTSNTPSSDNHRPDIVFFDAGNTLLHVYPSIGEVYAEVSSTFGCSVSPGEIEAQLLAVWREHLDEVKASPDGLVTSENREYEMWRMLTYTVHDRLPGLTCDPRPWFETLHETFGEARRFRLFPDVEETLGALGEKGCRIGVISNWDSRLEKILDGLGLSECFDVVVISSLVGYSKPHPRIFEIALERAEVPAEAAVHVGDTLRDDVEGARSVGVRAFHLHRNESLGLSNRDLLASPPTKDDARIGALSELLDRL